MTCHFHRKRNKLTFDEYFTFKNHVRLMSFVQNVLLTAFQKHIQFKRTLPVYKITIEFLNLKVTYLLENLTKHEQIWHFQKFIQRWMDLIFSILKHSSFKHSGREKTLLMLNLIIIIWHPRLNVMLYVENRQLQCMITLFIGWGKKLYIWECLWFPFTIQSYEIISWCFMFQ